MDRTPLDMSTEEVEDYVARYGLDDDMYFSLHQEAQERIRELESQLHAAYN